MGVGVVLSWLGPWGLPSRPPLVWVLGSPQLWALPHFVPWGPGPVLSWLAHREVGYPDCPPFPWVPTVSETSDAHWPSAGGVCQG